MKISDFSYMPGKCDGTGNGMAATWKGAHLPPPEIERRLHCYIEGTAMPGTLKEYEAIRDRLWEIGAYDEANDLFNRFYYGVLMKRGA